MSLFPFCKKGMNEKDVDANGAPDPFAMIARGINEELGLTFTPEEAAVVKVISRGACVERVAGVGGGERHA